MSFQVLAIAPIGIEEKEATHLLRFLSQVFYLEWDPTVEAFRKGGVCFQQTGSFREAKTTAQRLQMLGADFRIIHPKGHVVSEGHGRRRSQLQQPRTPLRRHEVPLPSSVRPSPPPEANEALESADTLVAPEPVEHQANDRHRKPTREVKAVPEDLSTATGLEFDDDRPGRSPFPGVEEVASESMFERDTRDLEAELKKVRALNSAPEAADSSYDGLCWDFNERMDEGVDPFEFDKETSEITPLEDQDQAPSESLQKNAGQNLVERVTPDGPSEEPPLDGFAEGGLVMLDGSEPKQKRPSSEIDFLPPTTGLEDSFDLDDDFDDRCAEESTLPPVDISLDGLDDD